MRDVHHICEGCSVCKMAKFKVSSNGLCTPFPLPTLPWVDISMKFVLSLSRSRGDRDSIFVVIDRFFKMTHFIPCHKIDDACYMANLLFKEVVRLHGLLKTIVSDRESKFLSHFWSPLEQAWHQATILHHLPPSIDGQTEVEKYEILGGMVLHIEFAYNRIVNKTTSYIPFELVYGFNPLSPLNLLPLPGMAFIVHEYGLSKA
ncbi:hypothetical protein CR513_38447, partial [Mucuna pruriens]